MFRWHKSFLEGQEQVEDEPCAGRPTTSKTDVNVERVRSLVRSDHRLMLRMMSSELNLNRFTVHQILTQDLDMRKVCAKMVAKSGDRPPGICATRTNCQSNFLSGSP